MCKRLLYFKQNNYSFCTDLSEIQSKFYNQTSCFVKDYRILSLCWELDARYLAPLMLEYARVVLAMDERPLKSQEAIHEIPADTTHKDITRAVLGGLEESPFVVITGPSRAGKSRYLSESLVGSLAQREVPVTCINCLEMFEDDVLSLIRDTPGVLVLDEASRLSGSESYLSSLVERKMKGGATVLVTTTRVTRPEDYELIVGLSDLPPIAFPIEMNLDDATQLVERDGIKLSEIQRRTLVELTRNPAILGMLIRLCNNANLKDDHSVESLIKEAISSGKLYFEPSLVEIKNRMCLQLGVPLRDKSLQDSE